MLRMSVLGKPIIALNNSLSGYMDFVEGVERNILIPTKKEIAITELNPIYSEVTEWAVCDEKHFIQAFKDVYRRTIQRGGYTHNRASFYEYFYHNVIGQYKQLLNSEILSSKYLFIESDIKLT